MSHHAVRCKGRLRRTPNTAAPNATTPSMLNTIERAMSLGSARLTSATSTPLPSTVGSTQPGRGARGSSESWPAPPDAGAMSLATVVVMRGETIPEYTP